MQHYGAATCLMDFTRNPLVGLWFACWDSPSTKGRVLAINSVDYNRFVKINAKSMEEPIEKLLPSSRRNDKWWVWDPKRQNERIIAQQSVFVFGAAKIQPEHVFSVESTDGVWDELQKYGVSLESLFCDFDGFARANTSAQQYGAENYLDKAMDEHAREKYENAIEHYIRALDASGDKIIYYHRGRAKASLGAAARKAKADASKADADYKQAIEDYNESPDSKEMFLHRGVAKDQLGDHKGAIVDYDQAIELDSKYAVAYNSRGIAKKRWRDKEGVEADYDYMSAIADYDRAIEIDSEYATAHYNRGNANYELDNYKDAIADYDRAIKFNPQDAAAYNNRGNAKDKLGGYKDVIADFDRAIELNPKEEAAYNNRGSIKGQSGDLSGAIVDFDKAIEINPQYAIAYNNRGLAKKESGDMKGAKADFQRAEKLRKNSPQP